MGWLRSGDLDDCVSSRAEGFRNSSRVFGDKENPFPGSKRFDVFAVLALFSATAPARENLAVAEMQNVLVAVMSDGLKGSFVDFDICPFGQNQSNDDRSTSSNLRHVSTRTHDTAVGYEPGESLC